MPPSQKVSRFPRRPSVDAGADTERPGNLENTVTFGPEFPYRRLDRRLDPSPAKFRAVLTCPRQPGVKRAPELCPVQIRRTRPASGTWPYPNAPRPDYRLSCPDASGGRCRSPRLALTKSVRAYFTSTGHRACASSLSRMHRCGRAEDKRHCRKAAYSADRLGPIPAAPLLSTISPNTIFTTTKRAAPSSPSSLVAPSNHSRRLIGSLTDLPGPGFRAICYTSSGHRLTDTESLFTRLIFIPAVQKVS
jgi:hypothetical protein